MPDKVKVRLPAWVAVTTRMATELSVRLMVVMPCCCSTPMPTAVMFAAVSDTTALPLPADTVAAWAAVRGVWARFSWMVWLEVRAAAAPLAAVALTTSEWAP